MPRTKLVPVRIRRATRCATLKRQYDKATRRGDKKQRKRIRNEAMGMCRWPDITR
jgi:hypothetical protein